MPRRMHFEAYQDTLYVHSLRQFYLQCDIYGTVDFIFDNAAVVFQTCNIYPRLPMANQVNAITAQGRTDPNQNTGISILNCSIRAADDLAQSNSTIQTYLGRPWKEYSRTVYMQSFLDGLIDPAGWKEWSGDFLNTEATASLGGAWTDCSEQQLAHRLASTGLRAVATLINRKGFFGISYGIGRWAFGGRDWKAGRGEVATLVPETSATIG
ncbi:hypothetical protein ACS0TY_007845 [Phlomoides rotata]